MTPCKETAAYYSAISYLAFEISKHADSMARWCHACPETISPERAETMRRETAVLLSFLGRHANEMGLVKADDPIYDQIRNL